MIIVNVYALAFIALAIVALLLHSKVYGGMIMLIAIGVSLLRRKVFGVYAVLFLAFVILGVGLMFLGLAISDMFHRIYKWESVLMGLAPTILSSLTFYFFTRREVANAFGLPKIKILEKVDKKELLGAGKFLLVSLLVVGGVILACYLIALYKTR